MHRFRNVSTPFDPTTEDKTHLQAIFSSYLAIASKVPYVIFLLVNAYISNNSFKSKLAFQPEERKKHNHSKFLRPHKPEKFKTERNFA
ncbi:UNVERIFIED_CONTAM: hypothetical protein NCL1_35035 [Trichonephila clavipes]